MGVGKWNGIRRAALLPCLSWKSGLITVSGSSAEWMKIARYSLSHSERFSIWCSVIRLFRRSDILTSECSGVQISVSTDVQSFIWLEVHTLLHSFIGSLINKDVYPVIQMIVWLFRLSASLMFVHLVIHLSVCKTMLSSRWLEIHPYVWVIDQPYNWLNLQTKHQSFRKRLSDFRYCRPLPTDCRSLPTGLIQTALPFVTHIHTNIHKTSL